MKRAEILKEAEKCVCGNREQDYGSPENNFRTIASFWATYLNTKHDSDVCITIEPEDVAAMLALLKVARIASGRMKNDNWIDLAGYAACGGEIAADRAAFNAAMASLAGAGFIQVPNGDHAIEPRTGLITEDAGEDKPQKKPWVEPEITVIPTPPQRRGRVLAASLPLPLRKDKAHEIPGRENPHRISHCSVHQCCIKAAKPG